MQGLWLSSGQLSLRSDLPTPQVAGGEALVRLRLAGVCATDLELVAGYYPFEGVLGHEFVGEIVAAPSAPERVGERVVGEINAACGRCNDCQRGLERHCARRSVLGIVARDGAFAEFLALPLGNLQPVPSQLSDEAAVFCEPLAAALEVLEQVHVAPSTRVLLVGAGRLGQLVARVLVLAGLSLDVVARHARQRALLAPLDVRCLAEDAVAQRSYEIVVEASGAAEGFALARRALRPRGTLVLKSTYAGSVAVDLSGIVVDEQTLVGSRCGPFAPALRLLASQAIDPTPLIEARYPLAAGIEAFARAGAPGALKILLEPS